MGMNSRFAKTVRAIHMYPYFLYLVPSRVLTWRERDSRKHPLSIKNSRIAAWTTAVSDGFAS